MTLAEIAATPEDAMLARLDRARQAFAQLDQNTEKWAVLNGRLYIEASNGVDCWITDGTTCSCPDSQIGTAARYLHGICRHAALLWCIEEQARHETLQAEAEESRQYFANEAIEASIIGAVPADACWYYPTVAGLGESTVEER